MTGGASTAAAMAAAAGVADTVMGAMGLVDGR